MLKFLLALKFAMLVLMATSFQTIDFLLQDATNQMDQPFAGA